MKGGNKNHWALFLLILSGIVFGGFIGEYLGELPHMGWLKYGQDFGFDKPFSLDLGIVWLQFSIMVRFTISGILGMIAAIIVYRRI